MRLRRLGSSRAALKLTSRPKSGMWWSKVRPRGVWDGLSFGIPRWTGNEPISRNPSGVPILDSCTAHGAFKAADLALRYYVLAAVINRAAFTGSMMTQGGF